MTRVLALLAGCALIGAAGAADVGQGRERSAACQSCHGPEGVSLGVDPETEVAVIAAIREESDEPAEIPDADAPAEDGPASSED